MTTLQLLFIAGGAALFGLLLWLRAAWRKWRFRYEACPTLLTRAEMSFYRALRQATPVGCLICPKVRLGDIVRCPEGTWTPDRGGPISAKHLDFVLVDDESFEILLAIELDDRSHDEPEAQKRDRFKDKVMAQGGVPLLRVPTARSYSVDELRTDIEGFL